MLEREILFPRFFFFKNFFYGDIISFESLRGDGDDDGDDDDDEKIN